MHHCIWCKKRDVPIAVEHIFPEAMGCPPEFVLADGRVCRSCNNNLGHLDQAVSDDFDIVSFMAGVPRKGGRPAAISNRGNMIGTRTPEGYEISLNMERHSVQSHDGKKLGPRGKSNRNIDGDFTYGGDQTTISFSIEMGRSPKFVRGIVKIALSTLAYYLGGELALSEQFDPIRDFVLNGKGKRPILLLQCSDMSYRNSAGPPFVSQQGEYAVAFRLGPVEFNVDLSPGVTLFPVLKERMLQMHGTTGWSYLPLDS